jgi:phasin family protein
MPKKPETVFDMDITKMMAEFKLPQVDVEAMVAAQRRNIETLTAANKLALEGMQAVAKRNLEILQQAMADLTEAMKALASAEAPQAKAAKQAELMKAGFEKAMQNMRELQDMVQKVSCETLALLNKRVAEALDEVKAMMAAAGKE